MAQLSEPRHYTLYWFRPEGKPELKKKFEEMTHEDKDDAHAGTRETSNMLSAQPNLVHKERAREQSGANLHRAKHLKFAYTGIWWYASYPNHYGGEASAANAEAGKLLVDETVSQLVEMIRLVKKDTIVPVLQKQFFEEAENPLKTKQ